jgi:hypothetical protein
MANIKGLDKVEKKYRDTLKTNNNSVKKEKLKISWGGEFEFDAVVREKDEIIEIHCLSLANYKTKSGKSGNTKLFKVFHDAQMMLLSDCKKRVLAFVDKDFYDKVLQDQKNGRFYPASQIEVKFWDLIQAFGTEKAFEIRTKMDDVLSKATDEN